jgi:hypothetical protein
MNSFEQKETKRTEIAGKPTVSLRVRKVQRPIDIIGSVPAPLASEALAARAAAEFFFLIGAALIAVYRIAGRNRIDLVK